MAVKRKQLREAMSKVGGFVALSPRTIVARRAPGGRDHAELGTVWLDQVGGSAYILLRIVNNMATWVGMGPAGIAAETLAANTTITAGTSVTATTTVTAGTGLIATTGGVTCADWLAHGVVINDDTGAFASQELTNGQLLIGSTGAAPTAATLTVGAGMVITNAAGSITVATFPGIAEVRQAAVDTVNGIAIEMNVPFGIAIFTDRNTAVNGVVTLTIQNNLVAVGTGVFVTVSNNGAADAQMTLTRVSTQTDVQIDITCKNNGAAALNGNIIVAFWVPQQ